MPGLGLDVLETPPVAESNTYLPLLKYLARCTLFPLYDIGAPFRRLTRHPGH